MKTVNASEKQGEESLKEFENCVLFRYSKKEIVSFIDDKEIRENALQEADNKKKEMFEKVGTDLLNDEVNFDNSLFSYKQPSDVDSFAESSRAIRKAKTKVEKNKGINLTEHDIFLDEVTRLVEVENMSFCIPCAKECQSINMGSSLIKIKSRKIEYDDENCNYECDCIKNNHKTFDSLQKYRSRLRHKKTADVVLLKTKEEYLEEEEDDDDYNDNEVVDSHDKVSFQKFSNKYLKMTEKLVLSLSIDGSKKHDKSCFCHNFFDIWDDEDRWMIYPLPLKEYDNYEVSFEERLDFFMYPIMKFKYKNYIDETKEKKLCLIEPHYTYVFTSVLGEIIKFLKDFNDGTNPNSDKAKEKYCKLFHTGLNLDDYYDFFFTRSDVLLFFEKAYLEIKNPSQMNKYTFEFMDIHVNTNVFSYFVHSLGNIMLSMSKYNYKLKTQYSEEVRKYFTIERVKEVLDIFYANKKYVEGIISCFIFFYMQITITMFYTINVYPVILEYSPLKINNDYTLNIMQKALLFKDISALLENQSLICQDNTDLTQLNFLDFVEYIVDKIIYITGNIFENVDVMKQDTNADIIYWENSEIFPCLMKMIFKLLTSFSYFIVNDKAILQRISTIYKKTATKLCPSLYRCIDYTDAKNNEVHFSKKLIEEIAINLMVQQNDLKCRSIVLDKINHPKSYKKLNEISKLKYSFESCSLSDEIFTSLIEGLDYRSYKISYWRRTDDESELIESSTKSVKNTTSNIDLIHILFTDEDLYSNKYNIINKSILPYYLGNTNLDKLFKHFTFNETPRNNLYDLDILSLKKQIDELVSKYHLYEDSVFLQTAFNLFQTTSQLIFNYLDLEVCNTDYIQYQQLFKHKESNISTEDKLYALFKKQLSLVQEGVLNSIFKMFKIVWLRFDHYFVIYYH